ncbi:hypothetical protein KKG29_05820 [Patescibacteria group bacterium]|nr:hypothetical protein [Patescibacteria group bacterium]
MEINKMKLLELVEQYLENPVRPSIVHGDIEQTGLDKQFLHKASDISEKAQFDLPSTLDKQSEEWREAYEERAGIMEFDGKLPRPKAEKTAEECLRAAFCAGRVSEKN